MECLIYERVALANFRDLKTSKKVTPHSIRLMTFPQHEETGKALMFFAFALCSNMLFAISDVALFFQIKG